MPPTPVITPTKANGRLIFSPVRIQAEACGIITLLKICHSLAHCHPRDAIEQQEGIADPANKTPTGKQDAERDRGYGAEHIAGSAPGLWSPGRGRTTDRRPRRRMPWQSATAC